MADIQKGVTQLRMLGFELGDVRAAVEDFIELRWQHDFKLTGRETSDDNTKEANRNNRALRGKRERLLAEHEGQILRLLHAALGLGARERLCIRPCRHDFPRSQNFEN